MANEKNLHTLSSTEARELGKKGGKASVKARAEKKALKDALLIMLNDDYDDEGKKVDGFAAIGAALFKQALAGNVKAFEVIRDTIGEKPIDNVKLDSSTDLIDAYTRAAEAIKGTTR